MVGESGESLARPDWYADPTGRHEYRYWDGSSWTANVADSGNTSSDPLDVVPAVGDERLSKGTKRADDITNRLAEIDDEVDSLRDRIKRDVDASADAPGGNILIASVLEKMGQGPPPGLEGTATLGQVEVLEKEKETLQTELAQLRHAADAGGKMPTVVKYESINPGKTQRAIELCEEYMARNHPMDATMQMLGVQRTKPVYKVVQGSVGRESQPNIDMKIVSVASCLPDADVDASDTTVVARMAFDAIENYASLPKVQAFFLLPYRLRTRTVAEESLIPPEEACRVYSGVENLMLEIYEELPNGGTITDEVIEQKIDELIKSVA